MNLVNKPIILIVFYWSFDILKKKDPRINHRLYVSTPIKNVSLLLIVKTWKTSAKFTSKSCFWTFYPCNVGKISVDYVYNYNVRLTSIAMLPNISTFQYI